MALDSQVLPIDFGQGVDSKTDPKLVVAGKLLLLENAVFTNPKRVSKRSGYTALSSAISGGGNLSAPKMVKSYKNELLCQDQGTLYSYSPSLQAWVAKGPYVSTEITEKFFYKDSSVGGYVDCAVLGNYALYIWSTDSANGAPVSTIASVIDTQTGAIVSGPTTLSTVDPAYNSLYSSFPKAFVLGSTKLAVTYFNHLANVLVMRILTISGTSISFGSEITIVTIGFIAGGNHLLFSDAIGTSSGAVIACSDLTANFVKVMTVDASGSVTHSSVISETTPTTLALSVDSVTGNAWVYWASGTTLRYQILSPTLATVLAAQNLATAITNCNQLTVLPISSTQQRLFFSNQYVDSPTGAKQDETKQVLVQSTGSVGTPSTFSFGICPYSKPISVSGLNYAVFYYRGPVLASISGVLTTAGSESLSHPQPTFFLIDLASGAVVARFASGIAKNSAILLGSYSPNLAPFSQTKFIFPCGLEFQNLFNVSLVQGLVGAASVTIDFASLNAYRGLEAADLLCLNGGIVSIYDGVSASELGFHLFPEYVSATQGTTGGSIGAGAYAYVAIFQWTDGQGNFHQSASSLPISVTVAAGSTNTVTLQFTTGYLTQKKNVTIALFRTGNNGTVYYLVTDPVTLTLSDPTQPFLSFTDTFSDTTLKAKQELYQTGNVVENSTPPPAMIMEAHHNRLWMVDSENPNTIWYSKTYQPGTGLSMSALLTQQMDPKYGVIAGLSSMDEKMITHKGDGNFYFAGDGANDTGTGSTLSVPQILPSDGGLVSLKSLCLTPVGIFYKKQKGIYLLDRALQEHYIGAEVEAWNSQSITGATLLKDKSQIRFLTDSGVTLVYDYLMSQWSTFTNHEGYASDVFQGFYTYVRTDGSIYQQNGTSFLDGASSYRVRAQLSWLALSGIQGLQRVRRIGLLGDFVNGLSAGHGVQISAAFDFSPTFQTAVPYYPGSASGSGVLRVQEHLAQQKCEALTFLIEEIVSGASGESISFTNLSLEAGMKRGMAKLSASQTIG